jgi:hypothetical protein
MITCIKATNSKIVESGKFLCKIKCRHIFLNTPVVNQLKFVTHFSLFYQDENRIVNLFISYG